MKKHFSYLILSLSFCGNLFYSLPSYSQNLRDIQRQERIDSYNQKKDEERKCKQIFEQSTYHQVLKKYDLSGKTDSGYNLDSGLKRVYINPSNKKILLINQMNGRSDLCNDYIYGRLNGIPLGYLGKKITTKCITYNSEKKNQYIIEVVKEFIYDEVLRKRVEFLVRYHKTGDCRGNWSNVSADLLGVEPYDIGYFNIKTSRKDYLVLARNQYKQKDYQGALANLNKHIKENPRESIGYNHRGIVKDELNDYEGAIKDYNKALQLNPKNILVFFNRAIAKKRSKDYKGAINDLNKVIVLDPKDEKAFFQRGFVKSELKEYKEAIIDYNKALQLNPKNEIALFQRGFVKSKLKDYEGAIKDFNKVIQMDPKDKEAFYNRAIMKYQLYDDQGAMNDYNKAIKLDSKHISAYKNRGILKEELKDFKGACSDWRKASSLGSKQTAQWVKDEC